MTKPFYWVLLGLGAGLTSVVLTGLVRRYALKCGLLDIPNSRSSHSVPTPRGGGIGVVCAFAVFVLVLGLTGQLHWRDILAIGPPAVAVAIIGLLDDRKSLSPTVRFCVHLLAAACYLGVSGIIYEFNLPMVGNQHWLVFAFLLFGLVWLLNLFNFMDGIDGIVGTEVVFLCVSLIVLSYGTKGGFGATALALVLGTSCAGFLAWNWPPAKIFLGDVGSGFLGLTIGMVALQFGRSSGVVFWVPLILVAAFLTDATWTLLRRMLRGGKWLTAHRSHAYQRLSRRWGDHRLVVLGLLGVNIFWLFPAALLAQREPRYAWLVTLVAYLPLICTVGLAGAGSPEPGDGGIRGPSSRAIGS